MTVGVVVLIGVVKNFVNEFLNRLVVIFPLVIFSVAVELRRKLGAVFILCMESVVKNRSQASRPSVDLRWAHRMYDMIFC